MIDIKRIKKGLLYGALFVVIALGLPACAHKTYKPKPQQAAVATAHPLATQAALDILNAGGNAFDAAVAATAALAVVEPYGSGLGGGGFYLLRDHKGNELMLDAREKAPLAAYPHMYLDNKGELIPKASVDGALAAGIPGIPAALDYLADKHGKLKLSDSLAPAIQLAKDGFKTDKKIEQMLGFRRSAIAASPAAAKVFLRDGKPLSAGSLLQQPDLATSLQRIATQGKDGFYQGELAQKLVDGVRAAGGIWTLEDLAQYEVVERQPITGEYRGMRISSAAPPSSGGIALMQMLNTIGQYSFDKYSDVEQKHLLIEAMRRAYRDRAQYLGDTDFVAVPQKMLTSPEYAAGLVASIRKDKATASADLPGVSAPVGGEDTTHFSIIDQHGNMVAATLSINYPFGSGFMPAGTGILLNDEMDDFVAKPGEPNVYGLVGGVANQIKPGKRMLSSMSPTIVEHNGRVAVLGTPGGSRIITMVLLAMLDFKNGGDAASMVSVPRFHHQFLPDAVQFEQGGLTAEQQSALQALGHQLKPMSRQYGNMQVVTWDKTTGKVGAASDPRGLGKADLGSYSE